MDDNLFMIKYIWTQLRHQGKPCTITIHHFPERWSKFVMELFLISSKVKYLQQKLLRFEIIITKSNFL